MKPSSSNGKYTVPAVCKALELVRVLAEEEVDTTTKGLAHRLDVPRTTCYRILRSLIAQDWVRPVGHGRHELSIGLWPLLSSLRQTESLARALQPKLAALSARSGLTAKVAVRQGDYAVTVARCESSRDASVAVRLGASFHLAYGSSGAVLLNVLAPGEIQGILDRAPKECWNHQEPKEVFKRIETVRTDGWCADLGAFRPSCHAISAPLRAAQKKVVASITLIGFPQDLPPEQLKAPAKMLLETAREAEKTLRKLNATAAAEEGVAP